LCAALAADICKCQLCVVRCAAVMSTDWFIAAAKNGQISLNYI